MMCLFIESINLKKNKINMLHGQSNKLDWPQISIDEAGNLTGLWIIWTDIKHFEQ